MGLALRGTGILLVGALTGCTLLSDLASLEIEDPPVDAASEVGAAAEAGDGGGAEGGGLTDGGIVGTSFCSTEPHTYCDDFDLGPAISSMWVLASSATCVLTTRETDSRSAPRSLRAELPTFSGQTVCALNKDLPQAKSVRVEADLWLELPPASFTRLPILGLSMLPDQNAFSATLSISSLGGAGQGSTLQLRYPNIADGGDGTSKQTSVALDLTQWHRVGLLVDTDQKVAKVFLDGTELGTVVTPTGLVLTGSRVSVGLDSNGGPNGNVNGKHWLRIDNVTIDTL